MQLTRKELLTLYTSVQYAKQNCNCDSEILEAIIKQIERDLITDPELLKVAARYTYENEGKLEAVRMCMKATGSKLLGSRDMIENMASDGNWTNPRTRKPTR